MQFFFFIYVIDDLFCFGLPHFDHNHTARIRAGDGKAETVRDGTCGTVRQSPSLHGKNPNIGVLGYGRQWRFQNVFTLYDAVPKLSKKLPVFGLQKPPNDNSIKNDLGKSISKSEHTVYQYSIIIFSFPIFFNWSALQNFYKFFDFSKIFIKNHIYHVRFGCQ